MTDIDQLASARQATARSRALYRLPTECSARFGVLCDAAHAAGHTAPAARATARLEREYRGSYNTLYTDELGRLPVTA